MQSVWSASTAQIQVQAAHIIEVQLLGDRAGIKC